MAKIDYSKLHVPKAPSPHGHSKEGSFYLQKTKEIPGRYKPYHKCFTNGAKRTAVGTNEGLGTKDSKE